MPLPFLFLAVIKLEGVVLLSELYAYSLELASSKTLGFFFLWHINNSFKNWAYMRSPRKVFNMYHLVLLKNLSKNYLVLKMKDGIKDI